MRCIKNKIIATKQVQLCFNGGLTISCYKLIIWGRLSAEEIKYLKKTCENPKKN